MPPWGKVDRGCLKGERTRSRLEGEKGKIIIEALDHAALKLSANALDGSSSRCFHIASIVMIVS